MSQYLSQKNLPYFNLLDQTTDLIWAGNPKSTSNRFNNYYDYYFSGEDTKLYIDGLFEQRRQWMYFYKNKLKPLVENKEIEIDTEFENKLLEVDKELLDIQSLTW